MNIININLRLELFIACQNIFAFTDTFTSRPAKILGSKSSNSRSPLPPGTTGTPESPPSATALTPHHGSSTMKATSAKSATTILA